MIDAITNHPLIALSIIAVPAVAVMWKLLQELFVRPRDFRIRTMEKDIEALRNELLRLKKTPASEAPPTVSGALAGSESEAKNALHASFESAGPLQSLESLYRSWRNNDLTDLQKKKFERSYVGSIVTWEVEVVSVSGESRNEIWVTVQPRGENLYMRTAIAVFPDEMHSALETLDKGQPITISGQIDRFFLSPILKDCRLVRTDA
jgi:hypothetical protein